MNKKKLTVFLKVQLIPALHKLKSPGKNSMDKWEDCEHALTTKSTKGDQKERAARRSQGWSNLAGHEGDVKNKVCSYGKNCLWAKEDLSSSNTERALEFHFQVRLHRSSAEESFSLQQGQELVSPKLCWLVPAIKNDSCATVLTNWELFLELTLAFTHYRVSAL